MQMKFRKTPKKQRGNYCYESVTGEKFIIRPEEYGKEIISLLHRIDDGEVNNNLKNSNVGYQKWQKNANKQWLTQHPGETLPKNWVLSLDSLTGKDGSGMADESRYMKQAVDKAEEKEDRLKEILYECLEEMDEDSRRLYQMYYKDELSQEKIAKKLRVSQTIVSRRIKKLRIALQQNC